MEAPTAAKGSGHLGSSELMERVVSRPNLKAALKRVRKNKGGPGIDGMTVEELLPYLRENWLRIRERGRSINQIILDLREYLPGWKQYFSLAETPGVFSALDQWIRHRLRTVHLKHWKRGRTVFRELRARGASVHAAASAALDRRWWRNARLYLHTVLTMRYFDGLGLPRLQP